MSWLSAVTGKAEDFLNKLDKSAAQTFQIEDEVKAVLNESPARAEFTVGGSPYPDSRLASSSKSVPSKLNELKASVDPSTSIVSSPVRPAPSRPAAVTVQKSSPVAPRKQELKLKKKDSDEALFDFLNSKDPVESVKKKTTPVGSAHHSRQSSTSSNISHNEVKTTTDVMSTGHDLPGLQVKETESLESQSQSESPTGSNTSADIDAIADAMKESPTGSDNSVSDEKRDHAQLSSLELENSLLRKEVATLNQEMVSVIQRAKDAQTELVRVKQQLNDYNSTMSQHDQLVRELQSRETDLTEALTAKDSQLAVLRVRLEEADRECKTRQKQISDLQEHRERILQDHTDSSGMHGKALDDLKEKLVNVETSLKREKESFQMAQQESTDRHSRLVQEQQTLAESLKAVNKKYATEKQKTQELSNQLKVAKSSAETARQELTEYKEKASRILQSKERLISSLRDRSGSGASGEAIGVSNLEYDSVKQERDMFRDEVQQSKLVIDNLRLEMQELENQLQMESDTAREQIRSLEEQAKEEKTRREDFEQELLQQKQELQYAIEEIHKQKTSFQSRINDRESEIEKLRSQLMTKSISSTTESELESRVRALTDSLIQKQTMLEALSTEKNSLVLQMERLEQQYRDIQNCVRSIPTTVSMTDDDEVRQRLPGYMKEGPSDTEVTRRMKRAVTGIDRFSVRLGIFLRRYPIARVFVIVYMALLHMWVMVVLLTYQPEIHTGSRSIKSPREQN
ncbi:golgin subfamily A member 5-like isoform X2 [Gigantopelta aegis]|uniref:golgin subfamily A member 5-like isoform X2 n=1 Tax=Gigantopelta aegis TaxID=1735272 RepID=UPI001B887961|nr:golgin subfamily A member 5-like isoform X2 [Gigantopelta aegis]